MDIGMGIVEPSPVVPFVYYFSEITIPCCPQTILAITKWEIIFNVYWKKVPDQPVNYCAANSDQFSHITPHKRVGVSCTQHCTL